MKTCPRLEIPFNGSLTCTHADVSVTLTNQASFEPPILSHLFPIDTECTFNCDKGLSLVGSTARNCLPLSKWDGLQTTCKGKYCFINFVCFSYFNYASLLEATSRHFEF